ncbi:MAG: hypothetical protein JOZ62_12520, partial [Acidobacteriaceae bacterium]|nr:hypothetical protein [Acidobacteriaceae bacterium]
MAQAPNPVRTLVRHRPLPKLLATAFLLTAHLCVASPASWSTATTENFILYSCGTRDQTIRLLETLEQARSFFLETSFGAALPKARVKVVAFADAKEYRRYQPNPGAYAYYQPGQDADYIVLQDLDPEHAHVALHEYAHSVIQHSYPKLPLWLNEGLADVYSSVELRAERFSVGRMLADRSWALQNLAPVALETL